ncbi:MAG TPA: ABC transporter permease [Gemmatimonadales bacterium]|nr:ABC transporter permease [Gemmatimonadales bacterium]
MTATALPIRRVLRAYALETRFEIVGALRTVSFAVPFIVVPLAVYLLFGVVIAGGTAASGPYGPGIANYLFAGFAVMGAIMPGLFSGVILAQEREGNLLRLKRALPQPPGASIVAKVLMAMAIAGVSVTLVAIAALLAGKITLSVGQVAIIWAVLIVGTIPFAAMGLLIGALVSGSAAPAWGNLVFLPMMWLSGLFIPLPKFLEKWVIIWPAFHLDQLALGLAGVCQFTFIPPALAAGVLVGVTVLSGGVAIRRLARVG